ncbi:hypothetical protein BKA67DRAFT_524970 [Truncatella angustata]|uniref:LsmAD domain-containing protein n=1 Tax=Truncatella angustata TaxID=152316 RepID=A0A9P8RM08_9PEZI|nr:uncharacterized protein BKA67DRAFT_524970 [Truncatella angustata]KAH6646723.1 hypothetical protein BKA67DRAFT_524970 [Truncatella angustata]
MLRYTGNFRTDTAISGNRTGQERVLQRWQPDAPDTEDHSLEKASGGGSWDQFKANEKLFGLKTDYNENFYTTQIDKSHPKYRERIVAAERTAKQIESSVASTSHVAEERVMDFVGGADNGDEEDKYSGVKRQQQLANDFPPLGGSRDNKYTPPARRAPTGSATVKGAPFDPAIISSQLKSNTPPTTNPSDENKARATSNESIAPAVPAISKLPTDVKPEQTPEASQTPAADKTTAQTATPLKPSAATSRTISPQAKEGVAVPSATSTVERDVLNSFKAFANQQRTVAEKQRSTKARADKEVKLIELKKFASSFKLPTPVPVDLIGIIAKDPAKQKAIQEKAARDAAECQRRKVEEKVAQEKKQPATTSESQPSTSAQGTSGDRARPTGASSSSNQPAPAAARHSGPRPGSFVPAPYQQFRNGAQHMGQAGGRQTQGLAARIRGNAENQKLGDMRQPPTGPANAVDPSYLRRGGQSQLGNKLNPNSNEFRPNAFAPTFTPNGHHPSVGSSPRSTLNNAVESHAVPGSAGAVVFITRKKTAPNPKKCGILSYIKAQPKPEGKNWADNDGFKPSFDTPPTWRQAQDDEKPDSTMRLSYHEYFERQPFATQRTPGPSHGTPLHFAHQYQLPPHMQQGAPTSAARASPHVPPASMHAGPHGPLPHGSFNGADDHRMMHSNSSQSFAASPRVGPAYPQAMNAPSQVPYGQNGMQFMPGTPQQMGGFNRSFSNNTGYMPQQMPVMIQPGFMAPQGMSGAQMQMYPGAPPQFMHPGAVAPQPIPGANGYPSPGRGAAPMMVHQGSQQGQQIYGMSPNVQYGQPAFPQQPGQSE